jgi:RimJ/RimL family protein N-acetyltransferase
MSTLDPHTPLTLCDGAEVLIRPIRPEDEKLYDAFLPKVSPDDIRLRFFAPMKDFSRAFIARLTRPDLKHAAAFIALAADTGEMLGVVRLHVNPGGKTGEYAVIVRSDLKGHGLGWLLMQTIIQHARSRRLRRIEGQVLRDNTTMLEMCRELGFALRQERSDPGIVNVTLDLAPADVESRT